MMPQCPRCKGSLIRQYAEVLCVACGHLVDGDNGNVGLQSPQEPHLTLPIRELAGERHSHTRQM